MFKEDIYGPPIPCVCTKPRNWHLLGKLYCFHCECQKYRPITEHVEEDS